MDAWVAKGIEQILIPKWTTLKVFLCFLCKMVWVRACKNCLNVALKDWLKFKELVKRVVPLKNRSLEFQVSITPNSENVQFLLVTHSWSIIILRKNPLSVNINIIYHAMKFHNHPDFKLVEVAPCNKVSKQNSQFSPNWGKSGQISWAA